MYKETMRRKSLLLMLAALLLVHVEVGAQTRTVKKFSPNTDSTVSEMTVFLKAVSKSYTKDADTLSLFFSEHWPEWSSAQQVSFLQLANEMLQKPTIHLSDPCQTRRRKRASANP